MTDIYDEYYRKQAGSGISAFAGNRYHVGNGFFGKILKKIKPALMYIGRQGWDAFSNMGKDMLAGETLDKAGRKQLIKTTENVLNDATVKLDNYKTRKQIGSGRRKKRKKSKKITKRSKTTKKSKKGKKLYKRRRTTKKRKKNISNFF